MMGRRGGSRRRGPGGHMMGGKPKKLAISELL